MLTLGLILTASSIIIAVLVAVLVYAVGVYLLHAPVNVVGLVAFLVLLLLLLGGSGLHIR